MRLLLSIKFHRIAILVDNKRIKQYFNPEQFVWVRIVALAHLSWWIPCGAQQSLVSTCFWGESVLAMTVQIPSYVYLKVSEDDLSPALNF